MTGIGGAALKGAVDEGAVARRENEGGDGDDDGKGSHCAAAEGNTAAVAGAAVGEAHGVLVGEGADKGEVVRGRLGDFEFRILNFELTIPPPML